MAFFRFPTIHHSLRGLHLFKYTFKNSYKHLTINIFTRTQHTLTFIQNVSQLFEQEF